VTRRLLGALLRLAPRGFREGPGADLLQVHDARAAELTGRDRRFIRLRRLDFGIREAWGLGVLVAGLWIDVWNQRERRGGVMFETLWQDARFAARSLRRNPGFAWTAIAVIAIGIGANAAIFTAANAFFFRPLPFDEPGELVVLYETNPEFGWDDAFAAPANMLDWREQVGAFADVSAYSEFTSQLTTFREGEPVLVGGTSVVGNFFTTLGVGPQLGRTFRIEETWEGSDNVVVLSHRLWQEYFGGDPDVVGKTIQMNDASPEIVGVMPAGFHFPSAQTDLWYPRGWAVGAREEVWFRRAHMVRAFARLAPGVDMDEADAQLQVVVHRLQVEYPETNAVMGAGIAPMHDFLVKGVRTQLLVLLGAVGLLLLLACTNVANLMLVRANDRTREVALRRALGAARARVARQMLGESVLIAGIGAAIGLALGWVGLQAIATSEDLGIDGATSLALDHRVVLFTAAVAIASGLLFGAGPVFRTMAGDADSALRDGGRSSTGGRRGLRAVSALVTVEVALALMLVLGAGLMVRTFATLRSVDPGFEPAGLMAVQFGIPPSRYQNRDEVLDFYDRFIASMEGRPGIQKVGTVQQLPLNGSSWSSSAKGETWGPDRVAFEVIHRRADADYFETVGTPLIRGRLFDATDGPDDPLVVVINETFAREHFRPDEDPIGERIAYDREPTDESNWYEIVGIVADQHQQTPRDAPRAEVFENRDQDWGRSSWVVIRADGGTDQIMPGVRAVLAEMDPLIPIARTESMTEVWRRSMAREAFLLKLLSVFGAVALLLATVGVYGVTAQAARRRTQEIGIRMALGARGRDVLRLMLGHGLVVIGLGLFLGVMGASLGARALQSLLFGVEASDPATLVGVAGLLGFVAVVACYVPARRATRLDPVSSLRSE
jgi:putative ABC transport system permease protein